MEKDIHETQATSMITTAATQGLDHLVRNFGGSFDRIICGQHSSALKAPRHDRYISLKQYASLLESASQETSTPSLGFIFGYHFDMRHFGPIGYAPGFSKSLGDALSYFSEYFDCIQENADLKLEKSGDDCILSYQIHGEYDSLNWRQDAETTIGLLLGFCQRMAGTEWRCHTLHFEHQAKDDDGLKAELTGVTPQFTQQENAIVFPASLLKHQIKTYDPWLLNLIKASVKESGQRKKLSLTISDEVYRALWDLLVSGRDVGLTDVAGEMGVSPRMIQTHLTQSGQTFRKIRAEVVLDRASELLTQTSDSMTEIACQLGYSESSAFSRAFQSRYGVSPLEFRRAKRSV